MPDWYFFIDPQEYGPLPWPQLLQAAAAGQLTPETPVRRSDLGWTTAGQIPELLAVIPVRQPVAVPVATKPAPRAKAPAAANPKAWAGASGASGIHAKQQPPRVKTPIPVGTPGRTPVPVGAPAHVPIAVAPAPPRSNSDDDIELRKKKPSAGLWMIVGLGIASVVLGSVMVVILVVSTSKKKKPDQAVAEKVEEQPMVETPSSNPGPAVNPVVAAPVNPAPVNPVSTPPATTPAPPTKKLPTGFANARKWSDAGSVRKLKTASGVRVEIVSLFLAADETGTPVKPAKADEDAGDEDSKQATTAGQFVFVVMRISNSSTKPVTYRSWNHAGGESTAYMADNHDTLLTGIAPGQTPTVSRLTKAAEVAPQKMIQDTLVFAAPDGDFSKLRLLLPHAALSGLGAGYFGWEIPREILTAGATAEAPQTVAAPPKADEPAAEPEAMEEPEPTVAGPAQPKPKTFDDEKKELFRSINGDEKKDDKKMPAKASDGKVGEKMETEK